MIEKYEIDVAEWKEGFSSGKEEADDIPAWAEGKAPKPSEKGKTFAKRLMSEKYGKGSCIKHLDSEYYKLEKHEDKVGKK